MACLFGGAPRDAQAYSVLTHEQLIDLTWKELLQPALRERFPQATTADLNAAHAYAYGGCAIQDLGYYPFSNEFFSNLTHYVRTGDFITSLLRNAQNVDEYAFALGALSHYVGDNVGHHDAVNLATPIAFPKLRKKYGPVVTYDENPHAHVRTEFAFDVDQLSRHRLAPGAYLRFIGLRVASRLLAQSFDETYSIPLHELLGPHREATRSYRWSVRSFLPRIAYAETVLHGKEFPPDASDASFALYLNYIAQADFQTTWNQYRRKPGISTHLLALLIVILPKIGPLAELAIKVPTEQTEQLYVNSVNKSIGSYESMLKRLAASSEITQDIPNRDLDTGERSRPGTYPLTDKTYAVLLHRLSSDPQRHLPAGLKQDILDFYADAHAPTGAKQAAGWEQVQKDLAVIQGMPLAIPGNVGSH